MECRYSSPNCRIAPLLRGSLSSRCSRWIDGRYSFCGDRYNLVYSGTIWSIPVKPRFIVQVTVVVVTFFLASVWEPLARSLGVVTGFFLTQPKFTPPSTWKGRLLLGGIGLILVLALFIGSRWVLGDWRNQGWVTYWRYSLLTLFATEVVPRFFIAKLGKWLILLPRKNRCIETGAKCELYQTWTYYPLHNSVLALRTLLV